MNATFCRLWNGLKIFNNKTLPPLPENKQKRYRVSQIQLMQLIKFVALKSSYKIKIVKFRVSIKIVGAKFDYVSSLMVDAGAPPWCSW